jgi:hypothetical protein
MKILMMICKSEEGCDYLTPDKRLSSDSKSDHRLITLYQVIHDALHAKSGQESTLKLQYLKTEKESVMGWVSSVVGASSARSDS